MRFPLLIALFVLSLATFPQATLVLNDSTLPSTRKVDRDPLKLVNKLTEGKSSDKEKFDAIFKWVTRNIRYDFYAYLSPSGASMPKIDRMLRSKAGICLDYAYLMDTLCNLAGIKNISIYGYAKDDLFDVNDSIYMDNHAWNAVKLENYWYVYDATWSSGHYEWDYTRFSKRLIKWRDKIISRVKLKTVQFKSIYVSECETRNTTYKTTFYWLSWKNRILLRLLYKFKLKVKPVFVKISRPDFYLTNPDVFAITHFPDNPYWSLVHNREKIREFECDSAYYHLNDSVYIKQERTGRTCIDCDNYFSLDAMNKEKQMKKNSAKFNNRNRFIQWLSDYNIANIFYQKSVPENDSLAKVSLIDSSLAYLATAKSELYKCLANVHTDCELHKTKNNTKERTLYEENRKHIDFMHSIIKTTYEETRKINYFKDQIPSLVRKYRYKQVKLLRLGEDTRVKPKSNKPNTKLKQLTLKLGSVLAKTDSMNSMINGLMLTHNLFLTELSDNVWKKIKQRDSIAMPYLVGTGYRRFERADNFKKVIVEERKKIKRYESIYISNMKKDIFDLADSCAEIGFQVNKLIDKRNDLIAESSKLVNSLYAENAISADSLKQYIKNSAASIRDNICWLTGGSSKLRAVLTAFKQLTESEKTVEDIIKGESKAEFERYKSVMEEITWRNRKYRSIPLHNLKLVTRDKTAVQKYKREYLKSLKKERMGKKKK